MRLISRACGLLLISAVMAACGGSASTSPGPSPTTAVSASAAATPMATPTAAPTPTPTPTTAPTTIPTATPTTAPTAAPSATPAATPGPLARRSWVRGQTVLRYSLASPGVGWVNTNRGVYQTVDNGRSWANATPAHLIVSKIRGLGALDANHALLAVVDVARFQSTFYVWRTSNGGASWAYVALPVVPNGYCGPLSSTCDFGTPGDPPVYIDYVAANTAILWFGMRTGIDGTDNHKYETTDGGATWTQLAYNPPPPMYGPGGLDRVQFMSPSVGTVGAESIISSTNAGWGSLHHVRLTESTWFEPTIYFVGASRWYANLGLDTGSTTVYRYELSTDQGRHWAEHTVSVPSVGATSVSVAFLTATTWTATIAVPSAARPYDGTPDTYRTTDAGAHWVRMGAQPYAGSRPIWLDANNAWTGPNPWDGTTNVVPTKIYATSNGGASWRLLTP